MKEENKQKRLNQKAIYSSMRWFNPNDSAKYNYVEKCSENYTIDTIG